MSEITPTQLPELAKARLPKTRHKVFTDGRMFYCRTNTTLRRWNGGFWQVVTA